MKMKLMQIVRIRLLADIAQRLTAVLVGCRATLSPMGSLGKGAVVARRRAEMPASCHLRGNHRELVLPSSFVSRANGDQR